MTIEVVLWALTFVAAILVWKLRPFSGHIFRHFTSPASIIPVHVPAPGEGDAFRAFARENNIKSIEVAFVDPLNIWRSAALPLKDLTEENLRAGFVLNDGAATAWDVDASRYDDSAFYVLADPHTAFVPPTGRSNTLTILGSALRSTSSTVPSWDTRRICQRAEAHLRATGIATDAYFVATVDFALLDHPPWKLRIDELEGGDVDTSRLPDDLTPESHRLDWKTRRILRELERLKAGAAGSQHVRTVLECADHVCASREVVRALAIRFGKIATFMPKPFLEGPSSNMFVTQSLWQDGSPIFSGDEYGGLSRVALHYMGGVLKHAASILAFAAPTTNSYRRLVPGYEAPINLAYSRRNRSSSLRLAPDPRDGTRTAIQFRSADPSCNPYLACSAMLMAGLDGINNEIDPGQPIDFDLVELPPEQMASLPSTPRSLSAALDALDKDREFLIAGGVFDYSFMDRYISAKKRSEVEPIAKRPHPFELSLYLDR